MAPLAYMNEPSIVRVDDTTERTQAGSLLGDKGNDLLCLAKATDAGYFTYIFQTTNVFMDIETKRVFQVWLNKKKVFSKETSDSSRQ